MKLTVDFLKDAERKNQTGRWSDGGRGSFGLYALSQRRKSAKNEDGGVAIRFCQRIGIQGRVTNIGLGPWSPGMPIEGFHKRVFTVYFLGDGHARRIGLVRFVERIKSTTE